MARSHRNISFATAESFEAVLSGGTEVSVRGSQTRELRNRVTSIARPRERCVFLPGRRNDIFAQIAETFWVIGGRNDVSWLSRYLPRAPDFSDDGGITWRGAYGPRLRTWSGIDQLDEWRKLLLRDRMSRRAVGILFDPARDFVDSRDVPCNNWLSWLVRDDRLHLNVAVRSNDAMWGFSGVNAFEWSVLHEMMAYWVSAEVGEATFLATSYHIYDRHYQTARNVINSFYGISPYDFGISSPPFSTDWDHFRAATTDWFKAEGVISSDPDAPLADGPAMHDPLLASTLRVLRLKWGSSIWSDDRLSCELAKLPEDDFTTAAYEFFGRKRPSLLANISQPRIAAFFSACSDAKSTTDLGFRAAIKHLHSRKNLSYAASWKRRGERISILPNIARKVDRLQAFVDEGVELRGETILDTAIDLYIYSQKYRLFLAELTDANASFLPCGAHRPFSDQDGNLDFLVDQSAFQSQEDDTLETAVEKLSLLFEDLWKGADGGVHVAARQRCAADLVGASEHVIASIANSDKASVAAFVRHELGT